MRPLFALLALTSPALAQGLDPAAPAAPGAVALYLQATQLYALGQQAQDPLPVITAARLLRSLNLSDLPRQPDPAPNVPTALTPIDPATLLATASALDAGDSYTDLIAQVATDLPHQPASLNATAATLAPGVQQVWTLTFFGGSYAELAILGDGHSNLDLAVTDASDTPICLDHGSADTALCGFTLRENGYVKVTVTNAGQIPDTYLLLTN